MPIDPGTRLGPYEILVKVGEGGMGEVYRARHARLERDVAVKVLPEHLAGNAGALARFEREAKAVAALSHPNILAIHDFGTEQGVSFAVMELLQGETLRRRLATGPLPWRKAIAIGGAIAEGLAAAHAKRIVHRDLKPENLFITEGDHVKILDFGLARLAEAPAASALSAASTRDHTTPGTVLGTLWYMSPEQVRGETAEPPSDIFSLGCVLHEMLTGKRTFARGSAAEALAAILKDEPPPPSASDASIPPALDDLVRHCLEKAPGDRFQSARDLAFALRAVLTEAGHQPEDRYGSPRDRPDDLKDLWRGVLGSGLAALGLVVLLGAGLWLWQSRARTPSAPGAAETGSVAVLLSPEIPAKSIAVLPFQNLSPDTENAYFADGITEDILTQLAKIGELKVIARTSVMRYKGSDKPVREIARELGVATVVEGSVRRAGNRVRITGQLIDARTEQHLWAETYDRELTDIFAIQSDVAQQVAAALKATLTPEDRARIAERPTGNIEAYDLYVKGRALYYHYRKQDNDQAIELFRKALAVDPGFALAQAGLADSLQQRYGRFGGYQPADLEAAAAAARKAIALNPQLPESHKAFAMIAVAGGHVREALAENRRAVELHQGTGFVGVANLGYVLFFLGRFDEALPWVRRSVERDPTNVVNVGVLGNIYDGMGQTAPAEATLRRAMELSPKVAQTYVALMTLYLRHQRATEALQVAHKALNALPDDPFVIRMAGLTELVAGHEKRAKELLERALPSLQGQRLMPMPDAGVETYLAWLDKRAGIGAQAQQRLEAARTTDEQQLDRHNEFWMVPFDLACVNAIEGNHDEAFRWLDKAYDAGWRGWPQANWSPLLDPLRQDARFRDLMRRIDEDVAAMRRRAGLG